MMRKRDPCGCVPFGARLMPMCQGQAYGGRRYFTREERKAWLEDYAQELEAELKAVRERISDLSASV